MLTIDLHAHTRFFHDHARVAELYDPVGFRFLAWVAKRQGLDGFATTNHDYYRPYDRDGVAVIPGIEVSSSEGHILVVGPDPPSHTEAGELAPAEVVDLAHDRDCAAIVAHPYRNSTVRDSDADFDAIEVNGKHPRTREWAEGLASDLGLPVVGGSDAHYPVELGRAFTRVDAAEATPESVVSAIRDGRVEPAVDDRLRHRLVRAGYRRVHEHKRWYQNPEEDAPGLGPPPGPDS